MQSPFSAARLPVLKEVRGCAPPPGGGFAHALVVVVLDPYPTGIGQWHGIVPFPRVDHSLVAMMPSTPVPCQLRRKPLPRTPVNSALRDPPYTLTASAFVALLAELWAPKIGRAHV